MNNPWNYFRTFYSIPHTQAYLKNCYQNFSDGDKLSFQKSDNFIYYLDHGKKYYDQAKIAPYELQPVLLFYGMIQLMKAVILTVDPNYPETTQVLAHGVSTRKKKKSHYEFLDDEVKIQKNGLITYFVEILFQLRELDGEKYKMVDLLSRIPELNKLFFTIKKKLVCFPLKTTKESQIFQCSDTLLDQLSTTESGLMNLINLEAQTKVVKCSKDNHELSIEFSRQLKKEACSPILYSFEQNFYYLPTLREQYYFLPEIIVHYLILYNLSMVCRYETDWWGEMFHHFPSNDYPFIIEFLHITMEKVPHFIALLLKKGG